MKYWDDVKTWISFIIKKFKNSNVWLTLTICETSEFNIHYVSTRNNYSLLCDVINSVFVINDIILIQEKNKIKFLYELAQSFFWDRSKISFNFK